MTKACSYNPEKRCFWSSCSFLDTFGNSRVHDCVRNPSGFHKNRKVVSSF
jgi:hypothetical protein